jgi:hypothetical protein
MLYCTRMYYYNYSAYVLLQLFCDTLYLDTLDLNFKQPSIEKVRGQPKMWSGE